jgi:hypothetical protein
MPTDRASQTIEIAAPLDRVLSTIRDVETQPQWVKEVLTAELLEEFEDGTPATAHFTATTPVGRDDYTLAYEHSPDGMSWSLVTGRLQTGQDATYALHRLGKAQTQVTFELQISHHLPLPGFIRRKVITDLVSSTVTGLKGYLES